VTDVAIVACDHGLGHVRRCVLIAEALRAEGATVTLLAPEGAAARVRRSLGLPSSNGVQDVVFATRTSPEALRRGDPEATRWEERLPDVSRYDRVVADTLPEALTVRPDAVIVAQFLWHDVIDGVDDAYRRRAEALLAGTAAGAPTVIGSEPFAMPAVRALRGFRPVGLHTVRPSDPAEAATERPGRPPGLDLLIAGGTTPTLDGPLRALVAGLVARVERGAGTGGPGPFRTVHVDRALLPDGSTGVGRPDWLREAEHTPALYDALAVAVIRPGLGTLTELLARGVAINCVYEGGNAEVAHNAAVVARLGAVGQDLGSPPADPVGEAAWVRGVLDGLLRASVGGTSAVAPGLRFDGAAETARIVLGRGPNG
jgi:hypothetical protein